MQIADFFFSSIQCYFYVHRNVWSFEPFLVFVLTLTKLIQHIKSLFIFTCYNFWQWRAQGKGSYPVQDVSRGSRARRSGRGRSCPSARSRGSRSHPRTVSGIDFRQSGLIWPRRFHPILSLAGWSEASRSTDRTWAPGGTWRQPPPWGRYSPRRWETWCRSSSWRRTWRRPRSTCRRLCRPSPVMLSREGSPNSFRTFLRNLKLGHLFRLEVHSFGLWRHLWTITKIIFEWLNWHCGTLAELGCIQRPPTGQGVIVRQGTFKHGKIRLYSFLVLSLPLPIRFAHKWCQFFKGRGQWFCDESGKGLSILKYV